LGSIYISYKIKYHGREIIKVDVIDLDLDVPATSFGKETSKLIRSYKNQLIEDAEVSAMSKSKYDFIGIIAVESQIYNLNTGRNRALRKIKMKRILAPKILEPELYSDISWDKNQGTCVIDYLEHRYVGRHGLKTLTREKIIEYLKIEPDTITTYNTPYDTIQIWEGEDIITEGVSIDNIINFAKKIRVAVYVLNDFKYVIEKYEPTKVDKTHPSICFIISNNHFYPISDKAKKSYSHRGKEVNTKILIEKSKNKLPDDKIKKIIYMNSEKEVEEKFNNLIKNNIFPTSIIVQSGKVYCFEDENNNVILYNKYHTEIEEACKIFDIQYTNQSIGNFSMQLLNKISTSSIPYSTHNKYVRDTLIEAKHNRIRVGFLNNSIETINDTYQAYDICKCYRSVLYNPQEDWIQLDWKDEWKPYKKTNKLELGLYYVQTNDTTLFKKSNIYSSAIIEHATKHGIKFKILKQLIPSKRREKEYFKTFIDRILQQYGETQFSKELINILTGMTGKTKNEDISTKINTDINQI